MGYPFRSFSNVLVCLAWLCFLSIGKSLTLALIRLEGFASSPLFVTVCIVVFLVDEIHVTRFCMCPVSFLAYRLAPVCQQGAVALCGGVIDLRLS